MEAQIVDEKIGDKAEAKLAFTGGQLVAELDFNIPLLAAGLVVKLNADSVIDAIEKAIPGQIDDAVLELLKAALKK